MSRSSTSLTSATALVAHLARSRRDQTPARVLLEPEGAHA